MKHTLAGLLVAGAAFASALATPAIAQVAGDPGQMHTPTVYTSEAHAQTYGYAPGYAGPLGPLGVLTAPITAPLAVMSGSATGAPCGVSQDFNGRYTALCGL